MKNIFIIQAYIVPFKHFSFVRKRTEAAIKTCFIPKLIIMIQVQCSLAGI